MHLADTNPLGGHLTGQRTLEKIKDCFIWPGMNTDIKNFCQPCPQCQSTAPHCPAPAPLVPLPIISVPFERVGMDLVDPLLKSAQGHEYILVIMDYTTHYPEVVPFRKATSENNAQELVLLLFCVGLPKDLLTYQGTPFVSNLIADVC